MTLDGIPERERRLILSKLMLQLMRLYREGIAKGHGGAREALYVLPALYVASFSGEGITLNKLSLLSGVPRPTAERRMLKLMRLGFVKREGKKYWVTEEKLLHPPANIIQAISLVKSAAVELEKSAHSGHNKC